MTSRAANKIKQRRERLKENQSPVVVSKPSKFRFWVLATASVAVIIYLLFLAYTSEYTNELVIPIIAAVTVLLLLIIGYLPKFYVQSLPIETGKDFDREKERLKLEDDTRKTFAQIVGGIVFLGGLIFTYNTFRLQQEGQFTDRFTMAVTQIGDEKLEVRLGGLYALERIAKDSPKDHWTVMEILSAYIRENAKKKEESAEKNNSNKSANNKVKETKKDVNVTTDIQAALTIIERRKIQQDSKTDRINLSGADLSGANLSRANLSRANLWSIDLSSANLSRANLSRAYLGRAYLGRAYLSEAILRGAYLSEAILSSANLSGADLREAYLSGADLSLVENLTFERLSNVIINENTKLPDYLESRKAELLEISKKNLVEGEIFGNESNQK